MTNIDDKELRAAKSAFVKATTLEQQLRTQYEALGAEADRLRVTRSLDEVLEAVTRLGTAAADAWSKELTDAVTGYVESRGGFVNESRLPIEIDGTVNLSMLWALFPTEMRARCESALRSSNVPFGPGADARARRLAEIAAERATIARQHTELIEESGLPLPLLTEVQQARDAAAAALAREEALEEERVQLQARRHRQIGSSFSG